MDPSRPPRPDRPSGHHDFINDTAPRSQRPTDGRRNVSLSIGFILLRADGQVSEAKTERRHSKRLETAGDRRSSVGCPTTRNLRRLIVTCCFLLVGLNHSGSISFGYSFGPIRPADLSGSGNESAQHCESMSIHRERSIHRTPNDVSNNNQHTAPTECPAGDDRHITVEHGVWRCELCGASGYCQGDRA